MKSRKDAERVVELSERREALHRLASGIRMAKEIAACDADPPSDRMGIAYGARYRLLSFEHLADELRDLVKREAAQQVAAIDKELKQLGVEPDEFEAAAPDAARPLKVVAKSGAQLRQGLGAFKAS